MAARKATEKGKDRAVTNSRDVQHLLRSKHRGVERNPTLPSSVVRGCAKSEGGGEREISLFGRGDEKEETDLSPPLRLTGWGDDAPTRQERTLMTGAGEGEDERGYLTMQ